MTDDQASVAAALCRACNKPLLPENTWMCDGCSCNSPRGINHGLVPANVCTCKECDPAETGSVRKPPGTVERFYQATGELMVKASDYDALAAELAGMKEQLDATECSHEDEEAAHADTLLLLTAARARLAELEVDNDNHRSFSNRVIKAVFPWLEGTRHAVTTDATIEQIEVMRAEATAFNDPTPLTPEKVMEMLPANCNVGKEYESGDCKGLLVVNWYESLKTKGTIWFGATPVDVAEIRTLGNFRKLLSGLQIQIPSRERDGDS